MNSAHPEALQAALHGITPRLQIALAIQNGSTRDILGKLSELHRSWLARLDAVIRSGTGTEDDSFPEAASVLAAAQLIVDFCEFPHNFPVYTRLQQVEHLAAMLQNRAGQNQNYAQLLALRNDFVGRLSDPERARTPLERAEDVDLAAQLALLAVGCDLTHTEITGGR